jgi:hypothetical protein
MTLTDAALAASKSWKGSKPVPATVPAAGTIERKSLWRRTWVRVTTVIVAVVVGWLGIAAEYIARHAGPLLRHSVVDTLQQRFHEPVELDSLTISVVRGLQVRGEGLRVLHEDPSMPPVVVAKSFTFHTSMRDLLHLRARVDTVHVEGLQMHIPPHSLHLKPRSAEKKPAVKLTWGNIVCDDAVLIIDTDKPGKQPLQFVIHNLQLTNTGDGQPFLYQADLINPHPTGTIHAFGHFGPWQSQQPRSTPLDGDYTFDHADLGTIKGIGGTLSSTGHFYGQLGYITVDGTTETPDFSLDVSHHPMPLHTQFHAYVDGTSGDTTLAPVQARLGNSTFTAQGTVMHVPGGGHDIALTVNMPHGRIEDLLELAMKTQPPVMRGAVTMHTHLHIPPGHESVAQKLQLAGRLGITGVEFTNPQLQDRIDGLSMRAQGRPREVKLAGSDHKAEVASQMAVDFSLANAMIKVSSLHYEVPGAKVQMVGAYSMDGSLFDFEGHVQTDAKASQMVTGWKSALLRPFDGLFAKNGAGLELPISVHGTKGDVSFGLHDHHLTPDQMAAQLKEGNVPRARKHPDAQP